MRAVVLREFGPPGNLRLEDVEDPRPGPGQVRIRTRAAGVHLIDTKLRAGVRMGALPLPELPAIPGREAAGVVDMAGDGAGDWVGRRVVAHLGPASGGYSELAVRDVAAVHALPDGLAEDAAVAMIGTGRTTMAILDAARITADDTVLVMAAAGGIGSLLVQAARAAGATVIGAAGGPAKAERVRALGADAALDYSAPGWAEAAGAVTVALDGVGGELGRAALELLAARRAPDPVRLRVRRADASSPPGTCSAAASRPPRPSGRAAARRASSRSGRSPRRRTARSCPRVQRFPLAEAAAAHAALESRATSGKVVLIP